MIRPRIIAKILARLGGYFWLPCPICNEPFAGFEWRGEAIMKGNRGQGVCNKPACCAEAQRRSDRQFVCVSSS